MRTFVILAVLAVAVFAAPKGGRADDQCGAKVVKFVKYISTGESSTDFECEMCLDLVLIGETYAECGEAEEEHHMEKKCDDDYKNNKVGDKACRAMVDKIAHEMIEDTEQDPSAVCYKVIHKHCAYSV